jgi:hypothetical protein
MKAACGLQEPQRAWRNGYVELYVHKHTCKPLHTTKGAVQGDSILRLHKGGACTGPV